MNRRPTQVQRVLAILGDGAWHSTLAFVDAGILRAAARIHELRRAGRAIETRRRGPVAEYRLVDETRVLRLEPAAGVAPCIVCGRVDVDAAFIGGQSWCPAHRELAA